MATIGGGSVISSSCVGGNSAFGIAPFHRPVGTMVSAPPSVPLAAHPMAHPPPLAVPAVHAVQYAIGAPMETMSMRPCHGGSRGGSHGGSRRTSSEIDGVSGAAMPATMALPVSSSCAFSPPPIPGWQDPSAPPSPPSSPPLLTAVGRPPSPLAAPHALPAYMSNHKALSSFLADCLEGGAADQGVKGGDHVRGALTREYIQDRVPIDLLASLAHDAPTNDRMLAGKVAGVEETTIPRACLSLRVLAIYGVAVLFVVLMERGGIG